MSNIKQVFEKKVKQHKIDSYVDDYTAIQGEIFTAIKNKDYPKALNKAFKIMPLQTRLKYICEIFYRGRYKCYSLGISRFKKQIDEFLITRDKNKIKSFYEEQLKENKEFGDNGNGFNAVKSNILLNILDENHSLVPTIEHLLGIDLNFSGNVEEDTEKYKKVLLEVCAILYPQNQAFRVLFV